MLCVIEMTRAWTACSSPTRMTARSTSSGVSLPSGVGRSSSFVPVRNSGAPPSSTLMCALSAHTTACHGRHIARRMQTFAPVPFHTRNDWACVAEVLAQ